MSDRIISVENLSMYFTVKSSVMVPARTVKAVKGVTLHVNAGETFGLVGESGCGKTTLGRTIVRIYKPTGGVIRYKGEDIAGKTGNELKNYHREVQMVFQDPYASLNPRMNVGEIIREPMEIHRLYSSRKEELERVAELLSIVGLKSDHIHRYPHEFSGGQRQRIGIARTLASNPKFVVCDEPISALDVSIQAQIINLLEKVQAETGVSYLFIAHDLSMVRHISDRIGVMYLGRLVESGNGSELYKHPMHPYSQALMSAIPVPDPKRAKENKRIILKGELPSPINTPKGCPFHTRCPQACGRCREEEPQLKAVGERYVACFLYD